MQRCRQNEPRLFTHTSRRMKQCASLNNEPCNNKSDPSHKSMWHTTMSSENVLINTSSRQFLRRRTVNMIHACHPDSAMIHVLCASEYPRPLKQGATLCTSKSWEWTYYNVTKQSSKKHEPFDMNLYRNMNATATKVPRQVAYAAPNGKPFLSAYWMPPSYKDDSLHTRITNTVTC